MNFPPHDRFCEYHGETMYGSRPCTCEYLARVRADERDRLTAHSVAAEIAWTMELDGRSLSGRGLAALLDAILADSQDKP